MNNFKLSRSGKVKSDGVTRLPMYMTSYNNKCSIVINIYPILCSLMRQKNVKNVHDFEYELSGSLNVQSNGAVKTPTYDMLFPIL